MNKYDYFLVAGMALWLIESACFGWNRVAQSTTELIFDRISMIMIGYGAISNFLSQFRSVVNVNIKNKFDED